MLTALLILAILLVTVGFIAVVSALLTHGDFFAWWFIVPEVAKGFGYAIAALCMLISDSNS